MQIKILNKKEVEKIYQADMQRDFPKEEIKPLKTILNLMEQGYYRCYGAFLDGKLCAYLFFVWERKEVALLDYFAVLPEYRRNGVGGSVFQAAGRELGKEAFEAVLVEIERISLAVNEEQKKLRMDRKRFYLSNDCRELGLRSEIFGTGYEILYLLLGGKGVNCEEIKDAYREIYHRMVKKEYWKDQVIIE